MKCRRCGCTDTAPCVNNEFEPCGWAKPGLCTTCAEYGRELLQSAYAFLLGSGAIAAWVCAMLLIFAAGGGS